MASKAASGRQELPSAKTSTRIKEVGGWDQICKAVASADPRCCHLRALSMAGACRLANHDSVLRL